MKNYLLTISLSLLFLGCAKKTHIAEKLKISNQHSEIVDSITKKDLLTQDKSFTKISFDLDTLIRLNGTPLAGVLDTSKRVKHFENDDLSIDFKRDQSGLNIAFVATPKSKTINARYHKSITTQNDIVTSENLKSQVEKQLQSKQDSTYNHVIDRRDPASSISGIRSVIIWSIVLLVFLMASYYVIKKKLV